MITDFLLNILLQFLLFILRFLPYTALYDAGIDTDYTTFNMYWHIQQGVTMVLGYIYKIDVFIPLGEVFKVIQFFFLFLTFQILFRSLTFVLKFIRG